MRRRLLSFLLAGLVVLGSVASFVPMRASALLPLGVMQSALATYVTSTGYKMWQDQGTGSDLVSAVGQLYDDFITVMSAAGTTVLTLQELDQAGQVSVDNSGNWVYYHDAAQTFQAFADWAQSYYSIPTDNTHITVVQPGPALYGDETGFLMVRIPCSSSVEVFNGNSLFGNYYLGAQIGTYQNLPLFPALSVSSEYFLSYTFASSSVITFHHGCASSCNLCMVYLLNDRYRYLSLGPVGNEVRNTSFNRSDVELLDFVPSSNLTSTVYVSDLTQKQAGSGGLALSLAQSVASSIGDSFADDDAVVIGVGAAAGTDAETLAGISAQGILAGDLVTDVTVTAADVIDTPVQPYPDIDGLGLPELGAALVSRFPFCIPWDFVDTVKLLNSDPVAPDIAVDLFPAAFKSKVGITGSTEFRINLGDEKYQKIGVFCRWGSLIGFCFGLALLTKRMIWTA